MPPVSNSAHPAKTRNHRDEVVYIASMKFLLSVAASASLLALSVDPLAAQDSAPKLTATTEEGRVLERALQNMSRLKGYHVEAVVSGSGGKAKIVGDLGEGALSLRVTDPKGNATLRVAVGGQFFLSKDDGKTWKTGAEGEREITILFSNLLTMPLSPSGEPWKAGKFTGKEVTVGGETLLHLEKPAAGKEAAISFWICKEKELSNLTFVRRLSMIVSATDGEFPIDVTYSDLAKPVSIKAPVMK